MNISVNPFFYITSFICAITGNFKIFLIISIIIIVHELGHIITAIFFKWKIDKIIILPFGGLTLFNEKIDKKLSEEFLILIMGPIFQIIFTFILNDKIVNYYSLSLLIFNLLPIIPLDGSKLINIILNKFLTFKRSYFLTIYISLLTIPIIFKPNLIIILVLLFLIKQIFFDYKNYNFIFKKLILEKYLYNIKFKKKRTIKNINKMYKNTNHLIWDKNKYITEKEYIRKKFDF